MGIGCDNQFNLEYDLNENAANTHYDRESPIQGP